MEILYKELINHGLQLIGTLLAAVVAPLIVKYIATLIGKIHNQAVQDMIWKLVLAAEKKFGSGAGTQKYEFVVNTIIKTFPALKNNKAQLDGLIHAMIMQLDIELDKVTPLNLTAAPKGDGTPS